MSTIPPTDAVPSLLEHPRRDGAAFTVEDLVVRFGSHRALDGVSVSIPSGAVTAVVGANGCGKSTLLRALGGLVRPDHGRVLHGSEDVARIPPRRYARQVALLPQSPLAPENVSVIDLVSRGRDPHRRWYDQWSRSDEDIVGETLARTGLVGLADRRVESLSGGQRQRAWVALTLAQRTAVLLLDEPTTFLDIAHQLEVLSLVRSMHAESGSTTVMVLHDLTMAARFADHLIAMRDGRVVAEGPPVDVVTERVLEEVFGIRADVITDARTGRPVVIPVDVVPESSR